MTINLLTFCTDKHQKDVRISGPTLAGIPLPDPGEILEKCLSRPLLIGLSNGEWNPLESEQLNFRIRFFETMDLVVNQ